jgi:hypothetical protein
MSVKKKIVATLSGFILLLTPFALHADLIRYDTVFFAQYLAGNLDQPRDLFNGTGHVVVDTEKFAFVDVYFDEYPINIDWQGVAPFVSLELGRGEPGFGPGTIREFYTVDVSGVFSGWFDTSVLPGANPLEFLDSMPGEFVLYYEFKYNDKFNGTYALFTSFTNKTFLVPEPSALILLSLGLVAIGLTRRAKRG